MIFMANTAKLMKCDTCHKTFKYSGVEFVLSKKKMVMCYKCIRNMFDKFPDLNPMNKK